MPAATRLTHLVAKDLIENDGCLSESNEGINNASRAVIREMHKEHGKVWLGRINSYEHNKHLPYLWLYDGGMVYNFGASFVLPVYDEELARLLQEREQAPYTGTKDDWNRLEAIFDRIDAIGGRSLAWT